MNTPPKIAERLAAVIIPRVAGKRAPDFIVGADSDGGPYLLRWYLTPWRRLQGRLRNRAERWPTRTRRALAYVVGLLPNVYLHCFQRDDDDRALHDHPSWAASYILRGGYIEHTIAAGGIHHRTTYAPGTLRTMGTRHAHRIELHKPRVGAVFFAGLRMIFGIRDPNANPHTGRFNLNHVECWTLFLFGPTVRDWGFHCPNRGWVHWREFTAAGKPGEVGRGCDA